MLSSASCAAEKFWTEIGTFSSFSGRARAVTRTSGNELTLDDESVEGAGAAAGVVCAIALAIMNKLEAATNAVPPSNCLLCI